MKRSILKTPMGQRQVVETVRIEGDEARGPDDGNAGFRGFWEFLTSLQANPTLIRNSVECPLEVKFTHSGRAWIAESRAIVDIPNDPS